MLVLGLFTRDLSDSFQETFRRGSSGEEGLFSRGGLFDPSLTGFLLRKILMSVLVKSKSENAHDRFEKVGFRLRLRRAAYGKHVLVGASASGRAALLEGGGGQEVAEAARCCGASGQVGEGILIAELSVTPYDMCMSRAGICVR